MCHILSINGIADTIRKVPEDCKNSRQGGLKVSSLNVVIIACWMLSAAPVERLFVSC